MSANTTAGPSIDPDRLSDFEERLEELEETVENQRETIREQNETIDELQEEVERAEAVAHAAVAHGRESRVELDGRAAVRWDDPNPRELRIENTETEQEITPLSKVYENTDMIEDLDDDLQQVKLEGVDAADLIGITGGDDDAALPIEGVIAQLRSDVRDDPSANKARASVVFRAFGARRTKTKGGKLVLRSPEVRNILEDPEKGDMETVNNNTLRRTIHQAAKLTSPEESPRDRDARDDRNLLTVENRRGKLALVADNDEWHEYLEEVEGRYQ